MFTAPVFLVIEYDDFVTQRQIVTAVGPKVGFLGFTAAGVKLRHRRRIGQERIAL
jgi:hypothetical protein